MYIYIYGSGVTGRDVYNSIKETHNVRGFLDSDSRKWGSDNFKVPIIGGVEHISQLEFDEIMVASLPGAETIKSLLLGVGVPIEKINMDYVNMYNLPRLNFLRDFAHINKDIACNYSIAEGGVLHGEFAKEINACFPKSKLYLFDTFEGFDARDIEIENSGGYSKSKQGHLGVACENEVILKLPHPEQVIIRKGYFPETAKGLESIQFFFVNLDFDLYQPTLEGLRFFYTRIPTNGVILVHDFFTPEYHGVAKAVYDFEDELGESLIKLPIGDNCSIAIVKINKL